MFAVVSNIHVYCIVEIVVCVFEDLVKGAFVFLPMLALQLSSHYFLQLLGSMIIVVFFIHSTRFLQNACWLGVNVVFPLLSMFLFYSYSLYQRFTFFEKASLDTRGRS